ncbi:MAG TPA: hypothetical protein VMW27_03215 [Thermoanaerobaculia bacterium]|nr:hypothetical protein [Thermoanaerobaculia bacterium]
MNRAAGRQAFQALESGLASLAARHPAPALSTAATLGWFRNLLSRRWPAPEQIRTLFPHLTHSAAARVAWSIGGLEARNRVLAACILSAGLGPVRPLVRTPPDFAALRPPLLLGTFHVGAVHALGPALERLPGPVLALRHGLLYSPDPPVEIVTTEGDDQQRAAAFQRALTRLGSGGFVVLAVDVVPGSGLQAPCLGRTLELTRGPFALARLAKVPLVPLVARWRRGGVDVELGEPISGEEESVLAAATARWLERYLLDSPADLGLGLLRRLLGFEPTAGR